MSLLNESILLLINILHIIVILFVVCTPFTNSNYLLMMHVLIVPFIMLHWALNNNTCSLTVMEKFIREKAYGVDVQDDECYAYKFIAPIYDFNKNHEAFSDFTWIATFTLWSISVFKLVDKIYSNEITDFVDLVRI